MSNYYSYRDTGASVSSKVYIGILTGVLGLTLVKCGAQLTSNRDNLDTEKSFNYIIDYNSEGTSIVKVDSYSDYRGESVEFATQDGLQVLTGIHKAEVLYAKSYEEAYQRALELTGGDSSKITSYDITRGLDPEVDGSKAWNKNFFNLNYDFDFAITETDKGVVITNISRWRDWDDDDKVQFVDEDDNIYLTTYMSTKLVNSKNASEEAVYDYALTLAGSEERISGDVDKENRKVRKLIKTYNPVENEVIIED